MVQLSSHSAIGVRQAAQAGDFRAIARWLNAVLMPYGLRVLVGRDRPGRLRVLIELPPVAESQQLIGAWREPLIRFICHRLWLLDSPELEGVRLRARFEGDRQILWERVVRISSPARRQQQTSSQLRHKIRRASRQKNHLKLVRTAMISGSTAAAFLVGGVIASVRSPVENSNALTSNGTAKAGRSAEVKAALETVPVAKHDQVANLNDPTVTMLFSGDVTLAENYQKLHSDDPTWAFAKLDEFRQADVAMVNLENPLTKATLKQPDKRFTFKAEPQLVEVLKEGGVDLVTLANNHSMDYLEAGLLETLEVLDSEGIMRVGAGRNLNEARRPQIVDVKGQRIAFLGYWGQEYAATDTKPGVSSVDEQRIAEDIRAIRGQVDWIVINYHWGQELATKPAAWQQKLARFTIDQGADVVIGHHPHVLQGTEIYKGRPIAYSLGNFIFGGNPRSNYDTAVLKVAVNDKQMKVEVLPIKVRQYQPQVATGTDGDSILKQVAQLSAGFDQPMQSLMVLDLQPKATQAPMVEPVRQQTSAPAAPASPASEAVPTTSAEQSGAATPTLPANPSDSKPSDSKPLDNGGFTTSPDHTPFNQRDPNSWQAPQDLDKQDQTNLPAAESTDQPTINESPDSNQPEGGNETAPIPAEATPTTPTEESNPATELVEPADSLKAPPAGAKTDPEPSLEAAPTETEKNHHETAIAYKPVANQFLTWTQPGKVGADLLPDVSLQGAPQW